MLLNIVFWGFIAFYALGLVGIPFVLANEEPIHYRPKAVAWSIVASLVLIVLYLVLFNQQSNPGWIAWLSVVYLVASTLVGIVLSIRRVGTIRRFTVRYCVYYVITTLLTMAAMLALYFHL